MNGKIVFGGLQFLGVHCLWEFTEKTHDAGVSGLHVLSSSWVLCLALDCIFVLRTVY